MDPTVAATFDVAVLGPAAKLLPPLIEDAIPLGSAIGVEADSAECLYGLVAVQL